MVSTPYLRLALCTYERLHRKDGRLRIADASDQDRVRIRFGSAYLSTWHRIANFWRERPRLTRRLFAKSTAAFHAHRAAVAEFQTACVLGQESIERVL